jgi:16S rRNA (cytidine1402-2'-O)-methyltransferase
MSESEPHDPSTSEGTLTLPDPTQPAIPSKPAAGLYLVATPIGNLRDITLRALDVLKAADAIACEDTRVAGKLTRAYGISAKLLRYDDHNAERARPEILDRLAKGEVIALISDAGTPLISDPGYRLARAAVEAGAKVFPIPGASALLSALVTAGLPTDRFLFAGFLERTSGQRKSALQELARVPGTLVFYEAPGRLAASLADMAGVLGDRPAAVARELTKLYEEVRRGSLTELAEHYRAAGAPKGGIVSVVGPPLPEAESAESLDALIVGALGHMSVRDAAASVAEATGTPRREVYARALALSKDTA